MADRAKRTSKINTWRPNLKQTYVEQDGKIFLCHFDRIFKNENLTRFNKFYIKKGSYENQLDIITDYTNFFINNYDFDNELATAFEIFVLLLISILFYRFFHLSINLFCDTNACSFIICNCSCNIVKHKRAKIV